MNFKQLRDSNTTFKLAFTHPSVDKESKLASYQRLELLGDKVLALVLTEYLFAKYPDESEGVLSVMLSNLVCMQTLASISLELGFDDILIIDKGDEKLGGRTNKSNLEDCLEAAIGAIYIEFGMEEARAFILKLWQPYISDKLKIETQDPKSMLQEIMQKAGKGIPNYELVSTEGGGHSPKFTYQIVYDEQTSVACVGLSKKEAQKKCAKEMLALLHARDDLGL